MWGDFETAQTTRRSLLAGLPIAIVALGSGAGLRAAGPVRQSTGGGAASEIGQWSARIGETFAVAGDPGWVLRLVSIEASGAGKTSEAGRRQGFLAAFEAVGRAAPEGDGTHELSNPSIGRLPLFLGSRDDRAGRARFIAAFN
jgi:hypothetical protein